MKTIGIIAEYNPFHNGHLYHLAKSKELTDANFCVAIISGNFLQRGLPAMWDKYTRGAMATTSGVDLCIELPYPYATGSARDFAKGAVSILDSLNSIDYLCFGAETDDIDLITKVADVINEEPDAYKEHLTNHLSCGMSYPEARSKALTNYFGANKDELSYIISQPNNILAIEYMAALNKMNSRIKPIVVKRNSAMYHDTTLYGSISSATAIRSRINSDEFKSLSELKSDIPSNVQTLIEESYMSSWPVCHDSLTPFLQSQLINQLNYEEICDISPLFANKLKSLDPITSYEVAANNLVSKDLTLTRVYRSLIHLIMSYTNKDRELFINNNYAFYANILSFRKESSSLLKHINKTANIPLITKKADFHKYMNNYPLLNQEAACTMWNYDMKATMIYNCLVYNTFGHTLPNDYTTKLPII